MARQHVRRTRDQAYGGEIPSHVKAQLRMQRRHDGGGRGFQQPSVAICWRLGRKLGADYATCAASIVDNNILPKALGEFLRHHA